MLRLLEFLVIALLAVGAGIALWNHEWAVAVAPSALAMILWNTRPGA
jgi:hypothetical protein